MVNDKILILKLISDWSGLGLGGDVLAEMKSKQEKRASVIPKSSSEVSSSKEEKEVSSKAASKDDSKDQENPFGGIKLR